MPRRYYEFRQPAIDQRDVIVKCVRPASKGLTKGGLSAITSPGSLRGLLAKGIEYQEVAYFIVIAIKVAEENLFII